MTGQVVRLRTALIELDQAADSIGQQSGPDRAIRFLREADRTFARLAASPGIGTRYIASHERIADLLDFPMSRFKAYIVFYRPIADGIEVWHVLHGARDYEGILAEDHGEDEDDLS